MNYLKKMCILRQVKQGFSGDGKTLSGLIKVEQYGKNVAVEVSIINFAPLVSGEYYCLLSDRQGHTEMLALRGKSLFNILSDLDISNGFCGVICYVKNEIVPIAYGVNGNDSYDWKTILNATLPPLFHKKATGGSTGGFTDGSATAIAEIPQENFDAREQKPTVNGVEGVEDVNSVDGVDGVDGVDDVKGEPQPQGYDDESVATKNYYEEEEDERQPSAQSVENARVESETENEREKERVCSSENANAEKLLHPFKTDGDGYYQSIKSEIDELLRAHPRDTTLSGAFSCSEWVRVKGEEDNPQYLVGVVYDDGRAKYICYALAAADKNEPPEEIRGVCTFVPTTPYNENEGFFVIFQSASTGECIKPQRV